MAPGLLLSLREVLEAALIIGIVLGALRKINRQELKPIVWWGAGSAIAVSVVAGAILYFVGVSFEGTAEEIFEGFTMLLAAAILTWMIFWMHYHARGISKALEEDVRHAVGRQGKRALFLVAFLAVMREGIELALFLTATSFATGAQATLIGAALGMVLAILLAWLLFSSLLRLNLRHFFQVTGVLLILFAAGLVAHGVHELNEAGVVPAIVEHLWNVNHILDEASAPGQILQTLFGYNGNPSLTEVFAYLGYFVAIAFGLQRRQVGAAAAQGS